SAGAIRAAEASTKLPYPRPMTDGDVQLVFLRDQKLAPTECRVSRIAIAGRASADAHAPPPHASDAVARAGQGSRVDERRDDSRDRFCLAHGLAAPRWQTRSQPRCGAPWPP